ncbi:metallophosphoesterase [Hydrogenobacter thermophilus]|uniref:metallophosphoesterase n=1 Tax=Hydrogenobacter thermophilus TaxID=940 RepID=UPI0030F5C7F8
MKWFVLAFFSIYSLMHFYVFFRLVKPNFSSYKSFAILLIFLIMLLSPIAWRTLDGDISKQITYWLALVSLLWMGFMLYVTVFTLLFDLYRGVVFASKQLLGINPLPLPSPRLLLYTVLLTSLSLSAYSYYETLRLDVIRIRIETEKLPVSRMKILHISDLHLGPVMGADKIKLVEDVWEKEKPDIIVSTGDLVDGNMNKKDGLAKMLSKINAPMGKFAVLGNHEYYRGVKQAIDFTERAGFELLRGAWKDLGPLIVAGVDDDDCRFFNACEGVLDEYLLLRDIPKGKFILLLKHKPRLNPKSVGLFDLMLSGHTHGGIYKPIGEFLLRKMFLTDRGLVKMGSSYVFVSKGIGTGGPPMRLFSPPDVAVIELIKVEKQASSQDRL